MEIKNSLYTFESDFDIINMCNMFLQNQILITESGSQASFVCPVQIKINGVNINIPNAFNVCYMLPSCSGKEISYFQMIYNREVMKMINTQIPDEKLEDNTSIILRNNQLLAVSSIKHSGSVGIGWHSVFLEKPTAQINITFDSIDLSDEQLATMHVDSTSRFQSIRNHILMNVISLSQIQKTK